MMPGSGFGCVGVTDAERADWYRLVSPPLDAPGGVMEVERDDYRRRLRKCCETAPCSKSVSFCARRVVHDIARERCIRLESIAVIQYPNWPLAMRATEV